MQIAGGWADPTGHELCELSFLYMGAARCRFCYSDTWSWSGWPCEKSMDSYEDFKASYLKETADQIMTGIEASKKREVELVGFWKNPGL